MSDTKTNPAIHIRDDLHFIAEQARTFAKTVDELSAVYSDDIQSGYTRSKADEKDRMQAAFLAVIRVTAEYL